MRSRPVFHLHIPKTGGQTFGARITGALPLEDVYFMEQEVAADETRLLELARSKRVVSAHVSGPVFSLERPFDVVTLIRDPVAQIVSNYLHILREAESPLHLLAKNLPFDRALSLVPETFFNVQSHWVVASFRALSAEDHIAPACRRTAPHLLECMDQLAWVGPTEAMDEFGRAFSADSGVPIIDTPMLNCGTSPATEELAARMRQWLHERPELYALDLFAHEEAKRRHVALCNKVAADAMAAHPRGAELSASAGVVFETSLGQIRLTAGWSPAQKNDRWKVEHLAGRVGRIVYRRARAGRVLEFTMGLAAGFQQEELQVIDVTAGEFLPFTFEPVDGAHRFSVTLGPRESGELALVAPRVFPLGLFTGDYCDERLIAFSAARWAIRAT
jgi:hypothetical protein